MRWHPRTERTRAGHSDSHSTGDSVRRLLEEDLLQYSNIRVRLRAGIWGRPYPSIAPSLFKVATAPADGYPPEKVDLLDAQDFKI
jgi:hypothetical protein